MTEVRVDWGDGTGSYQQVGYGADTQVGASPVALTFNRRAGQKKDCPNACPAHLRKAGRPTWSTSGPPTRPAASRCQVDPGDHQGSAGDHVRICFPTAATGTRRFTALATGSNSGVPGQLRGGPGGGVRAGGGSNGSRITPVGLGTCWVGRPPSRVVAADLGRRHPGAAQLRGDSRRRSRIRPEPRGRRSTGLRTRSSPRRSSGLRNGDTGSRTSRVW